MLKETTAKNLLWKSISKEPRCQLCLSVINHLYALPFCVLIAQLTCPFSLVDWELLEVKSWPLAWCLSYDLLQFIFQVVLLPDTFLKYWFHQISFLIKTTIYTLSLTCGPPYQSRHKSSCCMASFLSSLLSSYPSNLVALFFGPSDISTNLYLSLPLPLSYHFLCHLTTCQIVTCVVLLSQLATDGRDSILPLLVFLSLIFRMMFSTMLAV